MMIPVNSFLEEVEGAVRVAELVMKLGEVERATRHPDGRHETDTTHTVMLALIAGRLAEVHNDAEASRYAHLPLGPIDDMLDVEMVQKFALVHDLVEALAGDVNTIRPLTPAERAEKDNREVEALVEISEDIPWLGVLIQAYEGQKLREARFVRHLDKCMPKLTHIHNGCRTVREADMSRDELEASMRAQGNRLAEASPDLPLAAEFFSATSELCLAAYEEPPEVWSTTFTVKEGDGSVHDLSALYDKLTGVAGPTFDLTINGRSIGTVVPHGTPIAASPIAEQVREHVPHFNRDDTDLLKRAIIYGSAHYTGKPRWDAVASLFGVGSTVAYHLCAAAGIDPDQVGEPDPAEVSP